MSRRTKRVELPTQSFSEWISGFYGYQNLTGEHQYCESIQLGLVWNHWRKSLNGTGNGFARILLGIEHKCEGEGEGCETCN